MCYVDLHPVDMLRVRLLDWEFEASFARLDTYRIVKTQQQITVEALTESPADDDVVQRARGAAVADEDKFSDLLADMEVNHRPGRSQRSRPGRNLRSVLQDEFDPVALAVTDVHSAEDGDARPRQEELEDLEDETNLPNVPIEAQTAAVAVDSDAENTVAEEGGPRRQADVQPEAQREAPERQPRYDPAAMTCRFSMQDAIISGSEAIRQRSGDCTGCVTRSSRPPVNDTRTAPA